MAGRLGQQIESGKLNPGEQGGNFFSNFIGGIKDDLFERQQNVERIVDTTKFPGTSEQSNIAQGRNQSVPSSLFQLGGQGVGGVLDIAGRATSALIPDFIEDPIIGAVSTVLNTAPAEEARNVYDEFKRENPEAAGNFETAANLLMLFGLPKVSKAGVEASASGAGTAGRTLERSGATAAKAEKEAFARRLTRPMPSKAVSIDEVARTSETGSGPFRRSVVAPSAQEARAQQAVLEVPGISASKTYQQNYNAIREYTNTIAEVV